MNNETRRKKNGFIQTNTVIDELTGEIKEDTTTTSSSEKIPTEPAYIKLYLRDVLYLNGLQTTQSSLLLALLKQMNYQNEIILNPAVKKRIANQVGITVGTVNNNLSKFTKKEIFYRVDRGIYRANPNLFGKGAWSDIYELRLEVNYDKHGKELNTKILKSRENNHVADRNITSKE